MHNKEVDNLIEDTETQLLIDTVMRLTKGFLDRDILRGRIIREKNIIDMRKHPEHQSWMEER